MISILLRFSVATLFWLVARFARVRIEHSSLNRFVLNGIRRDFFGRIFSGGILVGGILSGYLIIQYNTIYFHKKNILKLYKTHTMNQMWSHNKLRASRAS